jgi:hypothetical protein
MENKKGGLSITFSIIAIIVGSALFRLFDFERLRFEKIGLAIIYFVVFAFSVYFLIKNFRNQPKG